MGLRLAFAVLVTTVLIAGCAAPTHRTVWVNPNYPTRDAAAAAYPRDNSECNALAYQVYGEYRSTMPQQQQQYVYGTYTDSRGNLRNYDGTITTGRQATGFEAFMDGYNMGNHMAARREHAEACMARKGWQQRQVPL